VAGFPRLQAREEVKGFPFEFVTITHARTATDRERPGGASAPTSRPGRRASAAIGGPGGRARVSDELDAVAEDLFVGTAAAAGDATLLNERGIDAVVTLTHDAPAVPADVTATSVPLVDGPRVDRAAFERAVAAVRSSLASGGRVLVHCSAGASRSPAVAATALALDGDDDLDAAFDRVVRRRPPADPHPALVRTAARAYVAARE